MPWLPREVVPAPCFQRNIRKLRKKYPGADDAVCRAIGHLGENPALGVPLRGFGHRVRKLRIGNPSARRGKSGGYRLIYDWDPATTILVLLLPYTHDQKDDVLAAEIARARREGLP